MHQLLQSLCDDGVATPLSEHELVDFTKDEGSSVTALFLAGDPEKKLETADVAVVVRELSKAWPERLRVGVPSPKAERAAMDLTDVHTLPSLVFYSSGEKVETLRKIQDWSMYAEAMARLLSSAAEPKAGGAAA